MFYFVMDENKARFIEFMIRSEALLFGEFTTKSGRKTPYFINTGKYRTGAQIAALGEFYAHTIMENFRFGSAREEGGKGQTEDKEDNSSKSAVLPEFDAIFGPSYKGIPLVVSVAYTLAKKYNIDVPFCFNRKEAKDHGERGILIGYQPKDGDRILIIEDVTTSGKSIRETVPILKSQAKVSIVGLVVSVNRMERGKTEKGALKELAEEYGMKTVAIVSIRDIIDYLYNRPIEGKVLIDNAVKEAIEEYLRKYGAQ